MEVFKSKVDKWLLSCLALSILACLLGASVALEVGGTINYVFAAVILIMGVGFPLWILVSTKYIVSNDDLRIISGPFSWIISIQSITSIQEVENAVTSPALSFDRLEVAYDEGKAIIISPDDKAKFIQKLGRDKLIVIGKNARTQTAGKIPKDNVKKNKRNQKNS